MIELAPYDRVGPDPPPVTPMNYGIRIRGNVRYVSIRKKDILDFYDKFTPEERAGMELVESKDKIVWELLSNKT